MLRTAALAATLVAGLFASPGCSTEPSETCAVNADCASGICWPDKTCAPVGADVADAIFVPPDIVTTDTATASDTVASSDTLTTDTGTQSDTAAPVDTTPVDTSTGPSCVANNDHVITRGEVPFGAPRAVTMRIATDATFDTRPTYGSQGELHWNLAQAFDGETDVSVAIVDPATQWFAEYYPDATYARPLGQGSNPEDGLLGVFKDEEDGVYLLGFVSPTSDGLKTQLTYDPPAKFLAFPIQEGASWETEVAVAGFFLCNPLAATENWHGAFQLDGSVGTPAGTFPAVRVVVGLYRWVGASFYLDVRHLFLVECQGVVGEVQGHDNDGGPELVTAEEIRRTVQ